MLLLHSKTKNEFDLKFVFSNFRGKGGKYDIPKKSLSPLLLPTILPWRFKHSWVSYS